MKWEPVKNIADVENALVMARKVETTQEGSSTKSIELMDKYGNKFLRIIGSVYGGSLEFFTPVVEKKEEAE